MSICDIIAQFAVIVEKSCVQFLGRYLLNLNFLDFALVLTLVFFLVVGFKRGFVRSILNLLSLVVVAVFAPNISNVFAEGIYNKFLESKVSSVSSEIISNGPKNVSVNNVDKIVSEPDFLFFHVLKNSGACSSESFKNGYISKDLVNNTIKEKVINYINFVLTLFVSCVLLFLLRIFLRKVSLKSIPVLGSMDSFLGGALGVFEFFSLVFILFNLFSLFCQFFNKEYNDLGICDSVNKSLAFKFFKESNICKFVK